MQLHSVKLDNYGGFWCVEPVHFNQIVQRVNSMDLAAHVSAQTPQAFDAAAQSFELTGGGTVAVIDIQGTMTKAGSSLGGGSTIQARHAIRQAEENQTVQSIILRIDSPGGSVAGTSDLAAEVARTTKPTVAFVEDLCASAAMWVAAQCDSVFANSATAKIGSIGTFMALYDISGALENEDVRTVVVKAGEFKGGGFPGMEISDEQIAEWQKVIDATQEQFTASIAEGRGMSIEQARDLNTGLVYMAAEALNRNLIDGIKTFGEVVEELRSRTTVKGPVAMSDIQTPQAATFKELVEACPGIDAKASADAVFLTECQGAEMTAADTTALYCSTLRDRLAASEEVNSTLAEEVAELKAATPRPTGVSAIGTSPANASSKSDDAQADFLREVRKEQEFGKSRAEAVKTVNRKHPELREALVASAN